MSYPCKLSTGKECDGCGRCEPKEEYELYCDNCGAEIDDLETYAQLGDNAYCEDCIEGAWVQWYKSPGALAHKIRKRRLHAGMSQKQLAQEIGVSQALVSSWEKGIRAVSAEHMEKINNRLE